MLVLPTKARIFIVFRFIIEYNNLMDFGAYVIGLFLYEDLKTTFWLVLKLEIIEL